MIINTKAGTFNLGIWRVSVARTIAAARCCELATWRQECARRVQHIVGRARA